METFSKQTIGIFHRKGGSENLGKRNGSRGLLDHAISEEWIVNFQMNRDKKRAHTVPNLKIHAHTGKFDGLTLQALHAPFPSPPFP